MSLKAAPATSKDRSAKVGAVVFDFHEAESLTFTNCSFHAIAQNRAGFTFANYSNYLSVAIREYEGERAVVFKHDYEKHRDTYWWLTSPRFPVREEKTYAVKVRTRSDIKLKTTKPMSAILWYRADGKELLAQDALGQDSPVTTPMPISTSAAAYRDSAVSGVVPDGAAFASVKICSDIPDLESGQATAISRIEYVEKEEGAPWGYDDLTPPKIERITPSPNPDFSAPVSFRISDPSGVSKVSISLDGTDITERVVFKGDVATYAPPTPWEEDSIHEFVFSVEDGRGNDDSASRFICFTRSKTAHEKVTVRDDGVLLCDGKPFFPIGIASVVPRPLHGNSISGAVKALKAAGFNLLSSYASWESKQGQELISACEREGIKVKLEPGPRKGAGRDAIIRKTVFAGRSSPAVFSWCIGDDTSQHRMPEELARDYEMIRAVDPDAIADHADASNVSGPLARFAPWTDMFLAEVYPIRNETPQPEELAKLQKAIGIAYGDLRMGGAPAPCVVPIVQAFCGWKYWKRYPTEEEIRAMTFLAIACKARGIRYYTYSPSRLSDVNKNFGVASTPERFAAISRITREVSAISSQLVTRDAAVQPKVQIVEGPQKASLGFPSVTALLKESGLLVAVNISTEPVKAVLSLPDGRRQEVSLGRNGVFVGKFADKMEKQK